MLRRLAVVVLVAGCHTMDKPAPGSSIQTAPSQTRTSPAPGDEQREWMKPADYRAGGPVPPMEDNRKINEQSCTEGIDFTAGNLRCR
jgi:hypothetical protein